MNYAKSPLKEKKSKPNRRVLSGGIPAERKGKQILMQGAAANGNSATYGRRKKPESAPKKKAKSFFKPWKVILGTILIAVCGILYIGHVLSTQQALLEVQQLERDLNKAQRIYNEQRLSYDRMVGPKEIYQKAREQGFINAGPADQIIISEP